MARVDPVTGLAIWLAGSARPASAADPGVAVLLVDTDRVAGTIDERIYGQFLEHINHSVVDGLYAEQIRGQGFEGKDFRTTGSRSARAAMRRGRHGRSNGESRACGSPRGPARPASRQGRVYVEAGHELRRLRVAQARAGRAAADPRVVSGGRDAHSRTARLKTRARGWQEVRFRVRQRGAPTRRRRRDGRRRHGRRARRLHLAHARRRPRSTASCGRTCSRRSGAWRRRSSAGPAAPSPRSTSGRTASDPPRRASTTPTPSGAATPTTTASAPTSSWNSAGSSAPSR